MSPWGVRLRRLAVTGVAMALAVGGLLAGPLSAPAAASCASASPSPYRFQGSVVALSNGALDAIVVRKDGTTVQVQGGTGRAGTTGEDDRTFVVGAVYQFEPVNGASPYQDNACTATKVIWSPKAPGPTDDPDPEQSWLGFSGFDLLAVGVLALGIGGAVGVRVGFGRGRKVSGVDRDDEADDDDSDLEDFPR